MWLCCKYLTLFPLDLVVLHYDMKGYSIISVLIPHCLSGFCHSYSECVSHFTNGFGCTFTSYYSTDVFLLWLIFKLHHLLSNGGKWLKIVLIISGLTNKSLLPLRYLTHGSTRSKKSCAFLHLSERIETMVRALNIKSIFNPYTIGNR